jgi:hypothetical protein
MGYSPLGVGEITVTCVCVPAASGSIALSEWIFFLHLAAAVALGITASAPFNGVDDQQLAIAYISMFVFLFFVRVLYSQAPKSTI